MKSRMRKLTLIVASLLIPFVVVLVASAASSPQVRLGFQAGDDWEPAIAADHFGHVYAIWPHYGDLSGICSACSTSVALLQVSNDRGQTWSAPRMVIPNDTAAHQVDVQIAVDPIDGKTVYAAWLQNNKSDTVVTRSTDFGKNWTTPVVADSTNTGTDKPILVVRGRDVYVGFDHQQKVWVAASHDYGAHFTSSLVRQNSEFGVSLAGGAAVDSKGNVYFSWAGYSQNGGAKGAVNLYISKSSDGGASWLNTLIDVSASPPDCSAYLCGWAYLGAQITLTADPGDTMYALWNAGAVDTGPERMYFSRSKDSGATWSTRREVSLAPKGVSHAFPAIASGGAGNVRIAWMDTRSGGAWNVYYRSSNNGGNSWSGESKLSSYVVGYSYLNANGFTFPYGDYFEVAVDDLGQTHAIWGEGPDWAGPGNIWYNRAGK